jgi:hypothetical protein
MLFKAQLCCSYPVFVAAFYFKMTPLYRYSSLCNPVSKFILPPSPHLPDSDYMNTDNSGFTSVVGPPKPDYINSPEGTHLSIVLIC